MALTPEQEEFRRQGVFASDVPRVCRLIPTTWDRPLRQHVWEEKMGLVPAWKGNAKTKRGERCEPLIAQDWSEATGRKVTRDARSLLHPDIPIIGATPDYVTEDGEPVECKMVGTFAAKKWNGKPPAYVEAQVLTQVAVLGKKRGHVAAWVESSENLVDCYVVEFSQTAWDDIVRLARDFWGFVERKERPHD